MAHSPAPAGRSRIAGYLIERPIASGAAGTVFRAIDERLGRRVALKVLWETASSHARERFLRSVHRLAGLHHPNVVLVHGAGDDRGVVWAAMELMPASLSQELHQRGRFSAADLRAVVRDACLGLDAVWKRGIVHRDIKPSNLMRGDDGSVKVADFGLAKDLSPELNLSVPDAVLGTAWYISAEQAAGEPLGVTSDLYSLGATLYHLAAGRPPFDSANALDVIVRHAIEPLPPLPEDLPESLARLIRWLLEKDPAKRPADYTAVLSALDDGEVVDRDPESSGALTRILLGAARDALQLGRGRRVRSLLEPLVGARDPGWTQAAFLLATALEESQAIGEARAILDDIAVNAPCDQQRALALWHLGRLAEKEGDYQRAIEMYSRLDGDISTARLPRALLRARIARLRDRSATPPA